MKIASIVGARPQFIKAAPVSAVLSQDHNEVIIHTGQHYDHGMSSIFFDELGIREPDFNLGIGSGPHGLQTGAMLAAVEKVLLNEHPDWVLVYGDTNSTLAGALAATKLHFPVAHIEAGLRSFNRRMPEEINRVLTDHVSDFLFCPTTTSVENLSNEGIHQGVHLVGDVMYDVLLHFLPLAIKRSKVLDTLLVDPKTYCLATIHRAENTDSSNRLRSLLTCLELTGLPVVFPLHPRTALAIKEFNLELPNNVKGIEPVGYLDMIALLKSAQTVLTDSGGLQKEAFLLGVPCITLREETEWVETIKQAGTYLSVISRI